MFCGFMHQFFHHASLIGSLKDVLTDAVCHAMFDLVLDEGTFTIRGKITFEKKPGKLPQNSCLHVSFQDTAIQDSSSVAYEDKIIDLSNVEIVDSYYYKIKTRKPKRIHDSYSVNAVLNVGWCPKSNSAKWIKQRDYLTTAAHNVNFSKPGSNFERDLFMQWYCKYFVIIPCRIKIGFLLLALHHKA